MGTTPAGGTRTAQLDDGMTPVPGLPAAAVDAAVTEAEDRKWTPAKVALWAAIALLGGVAWFMLAIVRGETVNAIWFVFASVCTYLIGYRFYSKVIERYIIIPNDRRATRQSTKLTARTTSGLTAMCCSATTSPPSPAPDRW